MLRVADLMQTDVRTIHEDAPVSEAIVLLADGHVSGLPVVNADRKLVGIISTTDILQAEAETEGGEALNRVARDMRVGDLMTPNPKTIPPDAEVKLAAQEMLYLDVNRLPVVENGKLVGVISQTDIVSAVARGLL
jgi:CBS domain-containing protein